MKTVIFFISRYLKSPRHEWRRSGSLFMILGIVISVAALTVTFSIFEGYQRKLKNTLLSTNSHIYIFSTKRNFLNASEVQLLDSFFQVKSEVSAFGPAVIEQAMITKGKDKNGKVVSCQLRGVNWQEKELPVRYREYVEQGNWELRGSDEIVTGRELAKRISAAPGDTVYLVNPVQAKMTMMGLRSHSRPYRIVGIYHSGMYESDSRQVFMNIVSAWDFSQAPGNFSRYEVKLKEEHIDRAEYLSYLWENEMELEFQFSCWQDFSRNLFDLLKLEKWVLFFILSFLIIVASFNVISTVSADIIERRFDIGILRATGFSVKSLHRILLGRILIIGLIAILTGEMVGIILSWLAGYQDFFQIKGDVYFLDRISVYFSPAGLGIILITAFMIIYFAALVPLSKLGKQEMIRLLRG